MGVGVVLVSTWEAVGGCWQEWQEVRVLEGGQTKGENEICSEMKLGN